MKKQSAILFTGIIILGILPGGCGRLETSSTLNDQLAHPVSVSSPEEIMTVQKKLKGVEGKADIDNDGIPDFIDWDAQGDGVPDSPDVSAELVELQLRIFRSSGVLALRSSWGLHDARVLKAFSLIFERAIKVPDDMDLSKSLQFLVPVDRSGPERYNPQLKAISVYERLKTSTSVQLFGRLTHEIGHAIEDLRAQKRGTYQDELLSEVFPEGGMPTSFRNRMIYEWESDMGNERVSVMEAYKSDPMNLTYKASMQRLFGPSFGTPPFSKEAGNAADIMTEVAITNGIVSKYAMQSPREYFAECFVASVFSKIYSASGEEISRELLDGMFISIPALSQKWATEFSKYLQIESQTASQLLLSIRSI